MFDRIVYIGDQGAEIKLKDKEHLAMNLMNLHLVIEDENKKILAEVDDLQDDIVKVRFLGEIVNGNLIGGVLRKPKIDASIRVIEQDEIPMIVGHDEAGYMLLGVSPFYNDHPVYLDVNNFFSNHFAIFGNSGSGKSCGISRIMQNMFMDKRLFPYKSNILIFDASGEYYNAFKDLNKIDSNYHYRFITTNETDGVGEALRLPIFLLNETDIALLLQASNHSQLPIIERMLKLARIFAQSNDVDKYKNHLIAKAIMTILYSNETSPHKRNEVFSILASCSTPEFNLESPVQGIGYVRKFRECFLIDSHGQFSESVLLTEYVSSFIHDEFDDYEPPKECYYTLEDLEKALNFTLISEGWLRNEKTYGDSVTLRVRLHSLITSNNAKYFSSPTGKYETLETYLSNLIISNGTKYQIININLDDVDDDFAKVITKVYSRLLFEFTKGLKNRASIPFHILVEEAHRYIQNDTDRFLIGYNIFERIAKEGRKYGLILGLISQRPVELSDTVISQCSNFLIFKMNHPVDVDYIRKMVPNISDDVVEKQKTLQSGTCLGFGSAFKIPLIVKLKMPDPMPKSGNCDVVNIWNGKGNIASTPNVNSQQVVTQPIQDDAKSTFINLQNNLQSGELPNNGVNQTENKQNFIDSQSIPEVNKSADSSINIEPFNSIQPTVTVDNSNQSTEQISNGPVPIFITPQSIPEASEQTNNNINLGQVSNDKEQTVTQQPNVINFGIGSTNDSSISKLPSQDVISPIPEVMPSNDAVNTTPTFM